MYLRTAWFAFGILSSNFFISSSLMCLSGIIAICSKSAICSWETRYNSSVTRPSNSMNSIQRDRKTGIGLSSLALQKNRLDKLFKYSEQIVAIDGDQALKCLFESTWFYFKKCISINGWIIT